MCPPRKIFASVSLRKSTFLRIAQPNGDAFARAVSVCRWFLDDQGEQRDRRVRCVPAGLAGESYRKMS